jgi:hypothetical protein
MADDKAKRSGSDRARIDFSQDYEVRDWLNSLGVDEHELRNAVNAVGDSADKGEYLMGQRSRKGPYRADYSAASEKSTKLNGGVSTMTVPVLLGEDSGTLGISSLLYCRVCGDSLRSAPCCSNGCCAVCHHRYCKPSDHSLNVDKARELHRSALVESLHSYLLDTVESGAE